jgi:hypothetical protein
MFTNDLKIIMDQNKIKNMASFELKVIDAKLIFDEKSNLL